MTRVRSAWERSRLSQGGRKRTGAGAAALVDRDVAQSFGDLDRLATHLHTTYGDDLTLLLVESGADAGELPDEVDDIVPLDSPAEAGRAFRRAARFAAERRASRLGYFAARAALAALSQVPEYVTLLDEQGCRIWSSPVTGRDFGFDMQALVGDDFLKPRRRTMAAQAEIVRVFYEALTRPGEMILGNSEAIRADGGFRRYETRMINLLDDPEIGAIVVMTHERESAPNATPASMEAGPVIFQAPVEQGPLITFVNSVSPKERIVYASPQSLRVLGLPSSEVVEPDFDWMGRVYPDDRERVVRESALADAGLEDVTIEYRYRVGGTGEYR
jgi:PAS domain-containing protein